MENLYVTLLNSISEGASIIHPNGYLVFINRSFCKQLNESEDYLMSADLYSSYHNRKLSCSVIQETMSTQNEVHRVQLYMNEDGFLYNAMLYEKPVFNEAGIEYVLAFAEHVIPLGHAEDTTCLSDVENGPVFIFESDVMRELVNRVRVVARLPANILLMGETGVGKDKLAEFIHQNSDRRNKPFVPVNCAAIAENLIESEFFGYEEGAFTGASRKGRKGLVEQADGGTLFLDEINSLPLTMQGKLLRAIESKMIRRVGGTDERYVDFRLIAASNENLEDCVRNGTFREDLYYRINVFTERIPPLRERLDDIVPLATYFIQNFCKRYHAHYHLSSGLVDQLLSYWWPGNVRELRNFAERLVVVGDASMRGGPALCTSSSVRMDRPGAPKAQRGPLKQRLAYFEREIIREALKDTHSKGEAARQLGIDPAVLSRKIKKYEL